MLLPKAAHALEDITVVTEADLADGGKIGGTNWMSGISGERYLHEITMPGTHDSAMANVGAADSVLDILTGRLKWTARTQTLGIDEQLTAGVRVFDLRLTNINPRLTFKETKGLWLCHGPRAAARFMSFTYYSKLPTNKIDAKYDKDPYLTLDQTMGYYFDFLKDHPTETVVVQVICESGAGDEDEIIRLFQEKMKTWQTEINPSTGKPYIYQQNKSTNDWTITKMPKLADTRGQVVLATDLYDKGRNKLGYGFALITVNGWSANAGVADQRLAFENHYETSGQDKLEYVEAFYLGENDPQYQDKEVNDWDEFLNGEGLRTAYKKTFNRINYCIFMNTSSNNIKDVFGAGIQSPKAIAEIVQPDIFTNSDALMKTRGMFYGWVNCDFITSDISRTIWLNNYPQGSLDYCTITFSPGIGSGETKTYHVQSGTQFTLPEDMYVLPDDLKKQGYSFVGWEIKENANNVYQPGYSVNTEHYNNVTVTAKYAQTWAGVCHALYFAPLGQELTITLGSDLVAQKGNDALMLPAGRKATINLNGHTINRNSSGLNLASSETSRAINTYGDLKIVGSGTITGGTAPTGGGIYVGTNGTLELRDVEITGNEAEKKLSADIHVDNRGSSTPALKVSGTTKAASGVLLGKGNVIADINNLTDGAVLVVNAQQAPTSTSPVVISDTLSNGANDLKYLRSGQSYGIEVRDSKAAFTVPYAVSFNLMGGRGQGQSYGEPLATQLVKYGGQVTKPDDPIKQGAIFAGWYKAGGSNPYNFSDPVTSSFTLEAHWTTEQKTISFDSWGGSEVAAQTVAYGAKATEPTAPTRDGYNFTGWFFQGGLSVHDKYWAPFDFDKPVTRNYALAAKWTPKSYEVTFDSDGGSTVAEQPVHYGYTAKKPASPTKDGYSFEGWFLGDSTEPYDFSTPVKGNLELTAHWKELQTSYTVTFDGNGGSPVPADESVNRGEKATIPATDPTREGYMFAGWYAGNVAYDFNNPVTSDLTLTAKWVGIPDETLFHVVFNSNGGSTVEGTTVAAGGTVTRPTTDPTREGYTFGGWYTDAACTQQYEFDTSVSSNLVLYAKWTQKKFTVTFDSKGDSSVADETVAYGSSVPRPADPTRDTYTFAGWYVDDKAYDFDTPVKGSLTLVAQWTPKYSVTFDADGGDSTPATQTVERGNFATEPSTVPSKTNYIFDGWYKDVDLGDESLTAKEVQEIQSDAMLNLYYWVVQNTDGSYGLRIEHDFDADAIEGNTTLYARWIPVTHTVSFNLNYTGGTVPDSQTITHGETASAPTPSPTRDNYNFTGWYTNEDCSEESSFDFTTPITGDITLYAGWFPDYHVLTFVTEESDSQEFQIVAYGQKAVRPETNPTRSGYTFGGWYADEGCTTPFGFDTTTITADTSIYAKWTINPFTVTFDANGGTPQPDEQHVALGGKASIPTANPTKDGRAFMGWYYQMTSEPVDDDLADEIRADSDLNSEYWVTADGLLLALYDFEDPVDESITLYARYEMCTVTFDVDGGAPQPAVQVVDYNASPTKPAEDPVKDGYVFDGWWLADDDEPFEFGTDTVTGDTILYARWADLQEWQEVEEEPIILTVAFDSNGGSAVTPQSQKVAYEGLAETPDDPTWENHTFLGWYEDVSDIISVQEYEENKDNLEGMADTLQVFDDKVMLRYEPATDPVYYDMKVQAQWELNPDSGLTTEVVLGEGSPTIEVSNLDSVAYALVSEDELDQGVTVQFIVNLMDKAEVPDADKTALGAKLKELGATDYQWLDISLVKIVGDAQTKVGALETPIKFTVEVPEAMRADGRTYYLLRYHDGEVSIAASGTGTILAAGSDRFSTYVLAYKDASGETSMDASGKTTEGTAATTNAKGSSLPRTGDSAPIYLIAVIALIGLVASGVLVAAVRRRS